jgi:hypothetical protein
LADDGIPPAFPAALYLTTTVCLSCFLFSFSLPDD